MELHEILGADGTPLAPPLVLEGESASEAGRLHFELRVRDATGALQLDGKGWLDAARGSAEAEVQLAPLHFEPDALQPGDLFPLLDELADSTSGRVAASAVLGWSDDGLESSADVRLADVTLVSGGFTAAGIDGSVHLASAWPPATPPGQRLDVARLESGLALTDGFVRFQLRPGGRIAVEEGAWSVFGGRVRANGTLDPGGERQSLILHLEGLDLGELLAYVDIEGLSGSGTLDGELPLVSAGETFAIRGGTLAARPEGGAIHYRVATEVASHDAALGDMGLTLAILENFRYESLRATVEGETTGESHFEIRLEGANPDVAQGQPVDLKLDYVLDSLAALLRIDTASEISASIE